MIKTELTDYQKRAVEAALKMKRYLLTLDTGSGKTLCALKLFEALMDKEQVNRAIVVCPKSALITWAREIKKHTGFTFTIDNMSRPANVSVVSYSRIRPEAFIEASKDKPMLIVDEAHVLKSSDSDLSKMMRAVMLNYPYAYGLTATPQMNHIEDLFYLINSFFPGFFTSYPAFMEMFTIRRPKKIMRAGREVTYYEVIEYRNLDKLEAALKHVMFRHTMSYDVKFVTRDVELNAYEMDLYRTAGQGLLHETDYRDFVGRLPDLQKVVNGSASADGTYNQVTEPTSKEQALIALLGEIKARGEGAIVFTNLLDTMRRFRHLKNHMNHTNIHYMEGASPLEHRKNVAREMDMDSVLFATMVGGVSLNLQAVNNIVFYDCPWSCGAVLQCVGRVARMDSTYGQQNVYFMVAKKTIDEYKVSMAVSNVGYLKQIVGGFDFFTSQFAKVRRASVIELRKSLLWGRS